MHLTRRILHASQLRRTSLRAAGWDGPACGGSTVEVAASSIVAPDDVDADADADDEDEELGVLTWFPIVLSSSAISSPNNIYSISDYR